MFLLIGLFITSYSVKAKNEQAVSKVFHVYVDDTYHGTVENKELVEDIIKDKEDKFKKENPKVNGMVSNEISYVSEDLLGNPTKQSELAVETIKEDLSTAITVKATVTAIKIDGEPKILLNKKEEAEKVLNELKTEYVGTSDFSQFETQSEDQITQALQNDETKISTVNFDKEIEIENLFLEPNKIYTVEEAKKSLKGEALPPELYKIEAGDTLESIATKFGMTQQELLDINEGVTYEKIIEGRDVYVATKPTPINVQTVKLTKKIEPIPYTKRVVEDPSMLKGETRVTQTGADGANEYIEKNIEVNGQLSSTVREKDKVIIAPREEITYVGTWVIPSRGTAEFVWPTNGGYISSFLGQRWGRQHKGLDIARPSNYTIKATDNGTIIEAGYNNGGYGNKIVIDHNNGYTSVYGHLDSINVSVGQVVQAGQAIGIMGNTGHSTGTHLHFELYLNGELLNPLEYVPR